MVIGHPNDEDQQLSIAEGTIGQVDDFKYLGSWVKFSMKDFNTRRALAFKACDQLWRVESRCSPAVKLRVFRACVESVLLSGLETWTLTKSLEKRINVCCTRLLRKARGWTYKDHETLAEIYGEVPKVTTAIKDRRLQFIGHCIRCARCTQPVPNLAQ